MPETVQKDLLEQLKQFVKKRIALLNDIINENTEQGSDVYNKLICAIKVYKTVLWYLTDIEYRVDMNKMFEIE